LYKEQGEQAAEQSIRKALTIDDKNAYAYDQLGVLLSQLTKRYVEAQQAFQKSIAIDPYDPRAHYHLGELLFEQIKDPPAARNELTKACELDPSTSSYRTALGAVYLTLAKEGDKSETGKDSKEKEKRKTENYLHAENCFKEAISTDMRDAEAHYRLGMFYIGQSRRGSGEAELKKAHELDHDNKDIKSAYDHFCGH
jgi:Flp pilus assembly protein TadD